MALSQQIYLEEERKRPTSRTTTLTTNGQMERKKRRRKKKKEMRVHSLEYKDGQTTQLNKQEMKS
jgi:hypothetical protein